jgi:hypothetical protein
MVYARHCSAMLCTSCSSLAIFLGQVINWWGPVGWASRSLDLISLDYAFWSHAKLQGYSVKIASVTHLRQQIENVSQALIADMMKTFKIL